MWPRAGGGAGAALEHVGGGGVDEAEDAVYVGGQGAAPLGGGHGGDGGFDGRPDAVVDDEDVEVAEGLRERGATRASPSSGVASSC